MLENPDDWRTLGLSSLFGLGPWGRTTAPPHARACRPGHDWVTGTVGLGDYGSSEVAAQFAARKVSVPTGLRHPYFLLSF